jgi:hypothetical protein
MDPRFFRADDGIRTRDPHLGKVMRYQLRYVRMSQRAVALRCAWDNLSAAVPGVHTHP